MKLNYVLTGLVSEELSTVKVRLEQSCKVLSEWVVNTREKLVWEGLVRLGWTPPKGEAIRDSFDCPRTTVFAGSLPCPREVDWKKFCKMMERDLEVERIAGDAMQRQINGTAAYVRELERELQLTKTIGDDMLKTIKAQKQIIEELEGKLQAEQSKPRPAAYKRLGEFSP